MRVAVLTNHQTYFAGDPALTLGTHNGFFPRENFGYYLFDSLDDFLHSLHGVNAPTIDPLAPRSFSRILAGRRPRRRPIGSDRRIQGVPARLPAAHRRD